MFEKCRILQCSPIVFLAGERYFFCRKLKVSLYTSPIYSKGSCALRQYFGFIAELRLGKLASGVPWVRFLGKSIRARIFGYNVTFVCASARPPAQNREFKQRRRVRLRVFFKVLSSRSFLESRRLWARRTHTMGFSPWLLGGSGGMLPRKIF